MKEEYLPTDEELSNPESPYFAKYWWKECEILPPDPWAYIVSDFQWSEIILHKALEQVQSFCHKKIGHYPDEDSKYVEIIEGALSTADQLYSDIECMISVKCIDLNFAWKWGEYQKSIAILIRSIPDLEKTTGMQLYSKNLSLIKQTARQWYALWYKNYSQERETTKISREQFDLYFERIINEIRLGKRDFPESKKDQILSLINAFFEKTNSNEPEELTNFYKQKKFYGEKFIKTLELATINSEELPPVGEIHYPKK